MGIKTNQMSNNKISSKDVLSVANSLNMGEITPQEIKWILDEHNTYCEQNPTGTWDLVVEQQLCDVLNSRNTQFYLQ